MTSPENLDNPAAPDADTDGELDRGYTEGGVELVEQPAGEPAEDQAEVEEGAADDDAEDDGEAEDDEPPAEH